MAYTNEQTPEQRAATFRDAGVAMPPATPVSPVMDAGKIGNASSPLVIKPATVPQTPDISTLASFGVPNTDTPVVPPTPTGASSFNDRLNALLGQSKNKATALQNQIGVETAPFNQQLNELNTQIKMHQANSIANQEKAMRSGETLGYASREAQNVQRTDAIEALKLSAIAEGMQGNVALATQHATNAINAKYAQIESDIENTKTQIYDNYDSFTPAEKKRADTALLRLDAQDAFVKNKKADEALNYTTVQTAIKYGLTDQAVMQKIASASSPLEAMQIAAPYLQDEKAQLEIKKLKQDMYYSRLKSEAELKPTSSETQGTVKDVSGLFASNKVGQTTKTLVGTILGVLNAAEDMANNSDGGKFGGISPFNTVLDVKVPFTEIGIPFRQALRSKVGVENTGYINGINLKIQQWASGAALTKQQTEQVAQMTPNKNDTDANVRIKLNNLSNFMQQQIKGSLQAEGIGYEPVKVDLFAPKTLEGIFGK